MMTEERERARALCSCSGHDDVVTIDLRVIIPICPYTVSERFRRRLALVCMQVNIGLLDNASKRVLESRSTTILVDDDN